MSARPLRMAKGNTVFSAMIYRGFTAQIRERLTKKEIAALETIQQLEVDGTLGEACLDVLDGCRYLVRPTLHVDKRARTWGLLIEAMAARAAALREFRGGW